MTSLNFHALGGTSFSSSDDLSTGILVTLENLAGENDPTREQHGGRLRLAADVAEFIAWHALNIYPNLNDFIGYDALRFRFRNAP